MWFTEAFKGLSAVSFAFLYAFLFPRESLGSFILLWDLFRWRSFFNNAETFLPFALLATFARCNRTSFRSTSASRQSGSVDSSAWGITLFRYYPLTLVLISLVSEWLQHTISSPIFPHKRTNACWDVYLANKIGRYSVLWFSPVVYCLEVRALRRLSELTFACQP